MPKLKLDVLPSVKHVVVLHDDAVRTGGSVGDIGTRAEGWCLGCGVHIVAVHEHLEGRSGRHDQGLE